MQRVSRKTLGHVILMSTLTIQVLKALVGMRVVAVFVSALIFHVVIITSELHSLTTHHISNEHNF